MASLSMLVTSAAALLTLKRKSSCLLVPPDRACMATVPQGRKECVEMALRAQHLDHAQHRPLRGATGRGQ